MTVYVEKARPTEPYSWVVLNGNVVVSRHQKKARAKERAFRYARERGAVVKEQLTDGTWRTTRNY
jgi:hypothetical protein